MVMLGLAVLAVVIGIIALAALGLFCEYYLDDCG